MKNRMILSKGFIGLFLGVTLLSCKEQKTTETKLEVKAPETEVAVKTEKSVNIEDYFSGPNFMKVLLASDNGLNLSEAQLATFTAWSGEHHASTVAKIQDIAALESDIKILSQESASVDKLLEKATEISALRLTVAATKLSCHQLVKANLESKQWEALVTEYQKAYPFVERIGMMAMIEHVNPAPNYMSVINANLSELNITLEQKNETDAWSAENHPKMMVLANKVIALEKDIYNESFTDTAEDKNLNKFKKINELRTQIVTKKTKCRNHVKGILTETQWSDLVAKTM